jgi:glycosyltransferase involved in cell wall biosynthesis
MINITPSTPLVSVITPSWNRARYLPRVHAGLMAQTALHMPEGPAFEWILGDDGSTDATQHVAEELAGASPFPVVLITASHHIGKAAVDNRAVAAARGQLVLWCDSDDVLLPDAIASLWQAWQAIPAGEREGYAGLTAYCRTQQGVLSDPFPHGPPQDVCWNAMACLQPPPGDMVFCVRTDLLRAHPFPEVDLVVPESSVWAQLGDAPTRLVPRPLKLVEYQAEHAISFSRAMAYNRGRAVAMAMGAKALAGRKLPAGRRLWQAITFLRYALHGEMPLAQARARWADAPYGWALGLLTPVAWALAWRDVRAGKVVRSHREFLAAQGSVAFSTRHLGQQAHSLLCPTS